MAASISKSEHLGLHVVNIVVVVVAAAAAAAATAVTVVVAAVITSKYVLSVYP